MRSTRANTADQIYTLGSLLRFARRMAGLSARDAAKRAHINPSHLSRIERGLGSPSKHLVLRLAEIYAYPTAELMRLATLMPPLPPWVDGDEIIASRQDFHVLLTLATAGDVWEAYAAARSTGLNIAPYRALVLDYAAVPVTLWADPWATYRLVSRILLMAANDYTTEIEDAMLDRLASLLSPAAATAPIEDRWQAIVTTLQSACIAAALTPSPTSARTATITEIYRITLALPTEQLTELLNYAKKLELAPHQGAQLNLSNNTAAKRILATYNVPAPPARKKRGRPRKDDDDM